MTTIYECGGEYRTMCNDELLSCITNKQATPVTEEISLAVLNTLTPSRKAVALAAIELYKRTQAQETNTSIKCSKDIKELMYPIIGDLVTEEFWILLLNSANRVIKKVRISVGGFDMTCVDIRVILKVAILNNAVRICLVHNHPSGNIRASSNDITLTETLKKAGNMMTIKVMDHVIIAKNDYYSFADDGIL
jgi:DNA repair protein RadC